MTTTIQITDSTHEQLKELGMKDETFDSIIQRLLREHKERGSK